MLNKLATILSNQPGEVIDILLFEFAVETIKQDYFFTGKVILFYKFKSRWSRSVQPYWRADINCIKALQIYFSWTDYRSGLSCVHHRIYPSF